MKYLKITTEIKPCPKCEGRKWFWDTFYHNKVEKVDCYKCDRYGNVLTQTTEDVTNYVLNLENNQISLDNDN